MMLKFFLITLLVIFVLVKIGGFIFRTMFWMLGARAGNRITFKQPQQPASYRNNDGIGIDYIPGNGVKKPKTGTHGGEYVDYEEVK